MGGSGSTRRVVVKDGIQLSEGVVDRLSGKEESSGQERKSGSSGPDTSSPSFDEYYRKKIREIEERNAASKKASLEEFAKAVQEVEKKFVRNTAAPVCQDLQEKVFNCYTENHRNTLLCASIVKEFKICVDRAQQNAVIRKG